MSDYKLFLKHHGIKGQKWGVRRFQDAAGRLTSAGKKRYSQAIGTLEYLTREPGWGDHGLPRYEGMSRRQRYLYRSYQPKGKRDWFAKNPDAMYKLESNSDVIDRVAKKVASNTSQKLRETRAANLLGQTAKSIGDSYRTARTYGEYATRTKGWGSTDYKRKGTPQYYRDKDGNILGDARFKDESTARWISNSIKNTGYALKNRLDEKQIKQNSERGREYFDSADLADTLSSDRVRQYSESGREYFNTAANRRYDAYRRG